jgi:hypothetical protein
MQIDNAKMRDLAWASVRADRTRLKALDWREQRVLRAVFSALREGRDTVVFDTQSRLHCEIFG